jgi:undecaprenyl-phosphate 4-deoxy-4-formamido-L-arabinose transferase
MHSGGLPNGISVLIPVYNAQESLDELVDELQRELQLFETPYEIVLVNDGSRDNSWQAVERLAREQNNVRGINLMRNYGQHNALLCGIRAARYNVVVTMDDDLQHPPSQIGALLAGLERGYDVVYGTPREQQHGVWRDVASYITKLVLRNTMGVESANRVSAFRAFRTELREAFARYQSPFVSIDVLLTWGTTRFGSVTVRHDPRRRGVSNYTFRKLVSHAINMLTGFSVLPLQLASITGFAFTIFGFIILLYVIGRYLIQGESVPGFPFLASTIAIFSGAQLFAIGIIGEYLARMHFRSMDKPAYAVRADTGISSRAPRAETPLPTTAP